MMINSIRTFIIPAAFSLLPATMRTTEGAAMLLAIGLQESRFLTRAQVHGPARGFWQFEVGGVRGVLEHPATAEAILSATAALGYTTEDPILLLAAIEDNDILAACFARALLFTLTAALPGEHAPGAGWDCYLNAWRPGKPHRDTWDNFYARAWAL